MIEEEYGYYEKAAWLLRDIGCMHCEAQFSKIKAGKAVVTREWLLRFCIALQPSLESIEKLLAKAQMEPLGINRYTYRSPNTRRIPWRTARRSGCSLSR